jgi:hypothetical protein
VQEQSWRALVAPKASLNRTPIDAQRRMVTGENRLGVAKNVASLWVLISGQADEKM